MSSFQQYGAGAIAGGVAGFSAGYQSGSRLQGGLQGAATGGLVGLQYGGWYGAAVGLGAGLAGAHFGSAREQEQVQAAIAQWIPEHQGRDPVTGADVSGAYAIQQGLGIFGNSTLDANTREQHLQLWRDLYQSDTWDEFNRYSQEIDTILRIAGDTAARTDATMARAGETLAQFYARTGGHGTYSGSVNGIPQYANEAWGLTTPRLAVVGDAKNDSEHVLRDSTVSKWMRSAAEVGARAAADAGKALLRLESRLAACETWPGPASMAGGAQDGPAMTVPHYRDEAWGLTTPRLAVVGDAPTAEHVLRDTTLSRIASNAAVAAKQEDSGSLAELRAELQALGRQLRRANNDLPRAIKSALFDAMVLRGVA